MVAFGKKLKECQIVEWRRYYLSYKDMKKKVNQYARQLELGEQTHQSVLKDFAKMLDMQIEKIVLFLLEQQGILAKRLSILGEEHALLTEHSDGRDVSELREAYRDVGRDLLQLLFFVEMNAIGVRKILKKFDKRFGYQFSNYYVKTRANHPYSQLKQVFKHVGIVAVVGSISRNLADLQDHEENYISIYDQPALPFKDSIVDSIQVAVDRLTSSTSFLNFLANHAFIVTEELPTSAEENNVDERYHFMSLLLNLGNTFLYMVNTYIVVPTADDYSLSLGAPASVCGAVIGSMAVAQVFSSVFLSAWSNKSYLRPLVFSSLVLLMGNTLYALAYDLDSISALLIGRLLCGLGSARAVNRRYISDCVPSKMRMQASAGFVSASALGMACGPALACLFQHDFKLYNLTFNGSTLPGWFMALAWLFYLIWLRISFKEPVIGVKEIQVSQEAGHSCSVSIDKGITEPLLSNTSIAKQLTEDEEDELDDDEEASEEIQKPVTSILAAYRLLTPTVKVQLFIYFMLKYSMEIVLAESSLITSHYFLWSTNNVAVFLACLGLTVLPVNIFVGSYINDKFEERQVLLVSEIIVCIGILASFHVLIPYSVPQYVISALVTFVFAEVIEGITSLLTASSSTFRNLLSCFCHPGVNLSLLSRVMSSRLSRGTYNGGLLSTEAGTIARVLADGTITLAGHLTESGLLNITLLPSLLICIASIALTCGTYNTLY
ncbi:hypothetical protein QQ045_030557 [Rhodiola kirilowii]